MRTSYVISAGLGMALGAAIGSRTADQEIERAWQVTPGTPLLYPHQQKRYRQRRVAEYAAYLGLALLGATYVVSNLRNLRIGGTFPVR